MNRHFLKEELKMFKRHINIATYHYYGDANQNRNEVSYHIAGSGTNHNTK